MSVEVVARTCALFFVVGETTKQVTAGTSARSSGWVETTTTTKATLFSKFPRLHDYDARTLQLLEHTRDP